MPLRTQVYPYKPEYPEFLSDYLSQIKEAIRLNKHHDHRRSLFTDFLRKAYDVDPVDIEIEHKIKAAKVRGFIDALYKHLIIEFKTDLNRERPAGVLELQKYFQDQVRPKEYLGVTTEMELSCPRSDF